MSLFLSSFLSFILLYKYWAIFAITFAASFLLPLPMNAILVAMGAFSSQGYLSGWFALSLTVLTNVLADSFGFFLTWRYGQVIIDRLIPKWDGKVFSVEKYLRRYAFGTIFLTRIAGPFAPYVNFLSGLIGVPYMKFVLADFLGNAIGAMFFFAAGYILGNYWQTFLSDTWLVTIVVSVLFVLYVIYKAVLRKRKNNEVDMI